MGKAGHLEVLKRGIVGVCAVTLLTGLCAVPAFAADAPLPGGKASTAVTVTAKSVPQISATVPTELGVAVDGTGALTFPAEAFVISTEATSNDSWPVKVTGIAVTAPADWTLVAKTDLDADKSMWIKSGEDFLSTTNNSALVGKLTSTEGKTTIPTFMGAVKGLDYATANSGLELGIEWTIALV